MEKLLAWAKSVRVLATLVITLASVITGGVGALALQPDAPGAAAAPAVPDSSITARLRRLELRQDSASAIYTFVGCSIIAMNDGIPAGPCEMLAPPQFRRFIRELLDDGGR
jgi:hypothetical protein